MVFGANPAVVQTQMHTQILFPILHEKIKGSLGQLCVDDVQRRFRCDIVPADNNVVKNVSLIIIVLS